MLIPSIGNPGTRSLLHKLVSRLTISCFINVIIINKLNYLLVHSVACAVCEWYWFMPVSAIWYWIARLHTLHKFIMFSSRNRIRNRSFSSWIRPKPTAGKILRTVTTLFDISIFGRWRYIRIGNLRILVHTASRVAHPQITISFKNITFHARMTATIRLFNTQNTAIAGCNV